MDCARTRTAFSMSGSLHFIQFSASAGTVGKPPSGGFLFLAAVPWCDSLWPIGVLQRTAKGGLPPATGVFILIPFQAIGRLDNFSLFDRSLSLA
jgi:hypothetical protein